MQEQIKVVACPRFEAKPVLEALATLGGCGPPRQRQGGAALGAETPVLPVFGPAIRTLHGRPPGNKTFGRAVPNGPSVAARVAQPAARGHPMTDLREVRKTLEAVEKLFSRSRGATMIRIGRNKRKNELRAA